MSTDKSPRKVLYNSLLKCTMNRTFSQDVFVQNSATRIKDLKNSHKILAHWVHSAEDLTRKLGLIKREKINRLIVRFFLF